MTFFVKNISKEIYLIRKIAISSNSDVQFIVKVKLYAFWNCHPFLDFFLILINQNIFYHVDKFTIYFICFTPLFLNSCSHFPSLFFYLFIYINIFQNFYIGPGYNVRL